MSATGISKEIETAGQLEELRQEVRIAAEELLSAANMKPGQILVVGCSSSEIASHKIGSYSSAEIGKAVFEELYAVTKSQGLYLAAQCCEHLNRAIIIEREAAEKYGWEEVCVVPRPHAGGSWATTCWKKFREPVAVEEIRAHAGIDIGGTLIGMHATLLNHCVVGKNCIIGAGALVPEGMVIPDGSVAVGVPARVIKPVTEAQIEANLRNAEHYVEHGKVHARALKNPE